MKSTKKAYISVLNIFSCFAVVMMHANGVFWEFSYDRYWVTANIIESVFYFAVPVFFMISGATLIGYRKRYNTRTYLKKRINKTLIPFLIWSVIGLGYLLVTEKIKLENLTLHSVLNSLINTQYVSVYWFFIALFAVYLCIPVLDIIPEGKRKSIFGYIILISFLINYLLPFICGFIGITYNPNLNIPLGNGYLFYVFIGYYIDNYKLSRKIRYALYFGGIIGLLMHCIGTWYCSYQAGEVIQTFKSYLGVPCILYSVGIFTFIKHRKLERFDTQLLYKISDLTFGIYLIHWFFLDLVLTYTDISPYSIMYRCGGGVLVFILSAGIIRVLKFFRIGSCIIP